MSSMARGSSCGGLPVVAGSVGASAVGYEELILSIVINVADSDIYIMAFLTCLAIYIIFYMENYRLRKPK